MADIQTIGQLLDTSLIPQHNKEAEKNLRSLENAPGFALQLLQLVASEAPQMSTRLAGALYFKNFIGRNWADEEGNHRLPQDDVVAIKREIIGLMISVPVNLQVQLGEAVSIIAESDFYKRWDTLVDELVARLTPDNTKVNNGVLQVAHAIFKRWRPLFRSDALFTEINHVLSKFTPRFLQLLQSTDALIQQNQNNQAALKELFQTLNLIVKLAYDLNCQDLAPAFEENLSSIMGVFHQYLTYTNPLLVTDDDDEAGPLERTKSGICELLQLFAGKYEDAFGELLQNFANSTWTLLTQLGPESKYDILVSKALHFLTAVARSPQHAQNFGSEEVLTQIVENIMLPNMTLRESDEELFEDDPIEFIRRDLEGSDSETRRRAATDFLRQLLEQFDKNVTDVVSKYITHYLSKYAQSPKDNWRDKDTALYLFTSIAAKGSTERLGVVHTNLHLDVVQFFQTNIAADLVANVDDVHPILKVDAIKYLYTFRSQLTKAQLSDAFPLLAKHLTSSNYVVYTYTAVTIDRLLAMSSEGSPVFTSGDIAPYAKEILAHLFRLIAKGQTPEKIAENEFLMRCIMRVLIVSRESTGALAEFVLKELLKITGEISKNPSNPRFNHYNFESLGAIIKFAGPTAPAILETALYEPLVLGILANDVTEFVPYVFQLLALILEINPSAPLPPRFNDLIPSLLNPALWESRGNIPALVRLLQAYMSRGAQEFVKDSTRLTGVLGIFQKLLASKLTETHGFDLMESVFTHFPIAAIQPYTKDIFIIFLTRLKGSKTELLTQRFVRLFYFLAGLPSIGPDFVVTSIDAVQNGIFGELYGVIVLPGTVKLAKPQDRKIAVAGLTKFVTACEGLATTYHATWARSVMELLKILEVEPEVPQEDPLAELQSAEIDDVSFGASFVRLNTAKKRAVDMFPEITNARKYVGGAFAKAEEANPRVKEWKNELSEQARALLEQYKA
ncbi:Cse1-domain-containing protein [Pyronema omphalodes]|nr:Cse1-domain-containing protein [Pyronema omphalodes]